MEKKLTRQRWLGSRCRCRNNISYSWGGCMVLNIAIISNYCSCCWWLHSICIIIVVDVDIVGGSCCVWCGGRWTSKINNTLSYSIYRTCWMRIHLIEMMSRCWNNMSRFANNQCYFIDNGFKSGNGLFVCHIFQIFIDLQRIMEKNKIFF